MEWRRVEGFCTVLDEVLKRDEIFDGCGWIEEDYWRVFMVLLSMVLLLVAFYGWKENFSEENEVG